MTALAARPPRTCPARRRPRRPASDTRCTPSAASWPLRWWVCPAEVRPLRRSSCSGIWTGWATKRGTLTWGRTAAKFWAATIRLSSSATRTSVPWRRAKRVRSRRFRTCSTSWRTRTVVTWASSMPPTQLLSGGSSSWTGVRATAASSSWSRYALTTRLSYATCERRWRCRQIMPPPRAVRRRASRRPWKTFWSGWPTTSRCTRRLARGTATARLSRSAHTSR
mmetsp:Transcript_9110/g.28222  ORF Transcript_9110/g.28222 Transcript_9110/m.28222 type:complete len:223 (+) Transcript_9110:1184-1852(+)